MMEARSNNRTSGILYIVSTPIGNLGDITFRAIETFKKADTIACEDTRVTRKLLFYYNIQKPLLNYREHNEKGMTEKIIALLKNGKSVVLLSDAGTPLISDPGNVLVKRAIEEGISVIPIPGPTAAIAALTISGLPTESFLFIGFLPRKPGKMKKFLESIKNYPHTLIFYESPFRVVKTLKVISDTLGDRRISVSRELTKMFEETLRGTISEVLGTLENRKTLKGEFVIIVEGI